MLKLISMINKLKTKIITILYIVKMSFFAYSQMIEISSLTTTACRNCDYALSLDYYEMLMLKKDVETEMMDVLELLCEITPLAKPDLGCQFPNHEKLLGNIRSCAKLVLRKYHGL